MCKPTVCQVEGCNNTRMIGLHQITNVYACHACRLAYKRNGTFVRVSKKGKPTICQVEGCKRRDAVGLHQATGIYACNTCRSYYCRYGTFEREFQSAVERPSVCQMPACKGTNGIAFHSATQSFLCGRCRRKYRAETGMKKFQKRLVLHDYTSDLCECGKPATQKIQMSTGGLHVYTGNKFTDVVLPVSQRYYVSLCDECALIEELMRKIDNNEYRPTGLLMREAAY